MEVEGATHREKQGSKAGALDAALQNLLQVRNKSLSFLHVIQRCMHVFHIYIVMWIFQF